MTRTMTNICKRANRISDDCNGDKSFDIGMKIYAIVGQPRGHKKSNHRACYTECEMCRTMQCTCACMCTKYGSELDFEESSEKGETEKGRAEAEVIHK